MRAVILGLLSTAFCLSPMAGRAGPPAAETPKTVRTDQMIGYGVVVGLHDTGDHLDKAPATAQALKAIFAKTGSAADLAADDRKAAGVLVTARIHIDIPAGTRVDLRVSSIGDATSLAGGKLLDTTLYGADGKTYLIGGGVLAPCPPAPDDGCLTKGCTVPQCIEGGGARTPPS